MLALVTGQNAWATSNACYGQSCLHHKPQELDHLPHTWPQTSVQSTEHASPQHRQPICGLTCTSSVSREPLTDTHRHWTGGRGTCGPQDCWRPWTPSPAGVSLTRWSSGPSLPRFLPLEVPQWRLPEEHLQTGCGVQVRGFSSCRNVSSPVSSPCRKGACGTAVGP